MSKKVWKKMAAIVLTAIVAVSLLTTAEIVSGVGAVFAQAAEIEEGSWVIQKKEHTPETIPGKAATYTEDGLTEGSKCSVCGEILTAQETIDALGHKLEKTEAKAATCTADGNIEHSTCKTCGKLFSDAEGKTPVEAKDTVITKTEHTAGEAVIENKVDATCETAGSYDEVVYCTVCGEEVSRTVKTIGALGHKLTPTAAKDATCEEVGNSAYWTCETCGKYFSDEEGKTPIAIEDTVTGKVAHTPGEAVKENEVAATCETSGSYDEVVYCTVCGEELSRTGKTIDALGHDWGDWTVVKEATVTEEGLEVRVCRNDPSHKDERVIEKKQPTSIKKAIVTAKAQTYTGKALTPAPTVKLGTVTLKKGTDYTVTYKNNTNAGKVTITVKGKGNYKGTTTKTFTIKQATNGITKFSPISKTLKYNKSKAQTFQLKATARFGTKVTFALDSKTATKVKKCVAVSKAGKVTVKAGTPRGTYTVKVKVTAAGTKNYKAKTVTKSLKIVIK